MSAAQGTKRRAGTLTGLGKVWRIALTASEGLPADRWDRPHTGCHRHASLRLNASLAVSDVAASLGQAPAQSLDNCADVIATDAWRWTGVLGDVHSH